jgi:Bacteriophage Mu Gam like protein
MSLAEQYDDLDQHLIGDEAELTEPHLGDEAHVERLLRGLAWRNRKIAQARELVESERQRLAEWLEEQEHRYDTSFHLTVLEGYHRARLADDPKAKTISLPSGTLTARTGQPKWDIDAETFIPWALANRGDHLLRVKHEPDRAEMKRTLTIEGGNAVTDNGEVVAGVVIEPAEVKFSVKVEG